MTQYSPAKTGEYQKLLYLPNNSDQEWENHQQMYERYAVCILLSCFAACFLPKPYCLVYFLDGSPTIQKTTDNATVLSYEFNYSESS